MKDTICWEPSPDSINSSRMMDFINFINKENKLSISSYKELYRWSINNIEEFWHLFSHFSEMIFLKSSDKVVDDVTLMPGASWF